MKLSVRGLAIAAGIGWALAMLLTGLANLAWPPYGDGFLTMMASVYPGYDGPAGIGSVIVAALYALVDGAACGAVLACLYNAVTR